MGLNLEWLPEQPGSLPPPYLRKYGGITVLVPPHCLAPTTPRIAGREGEVVGRQGGREAGTGQANVEHGDGVGLDLVGGVGSAHTQRTREG